MTFFPSYLPSSKTVCKPLLACIFTVFMLVTHHTAFAQIEHIPVAHPIYSVLQRWEAQGFLPRDISTSVLPLQRKELETALHAVRRRDSLLSEADIAVLVRFEQEFGIATKSDASAYATLFPSRTDSTRLLGEHLFDASEKYVFLLRDSLVTVRVLPFLRVEGRAQTGAITAQMPQTGAFPIDREQTTALLGAIGGRIAGTVAKSVGFTLQAQTGRTFGGIPLFLYDDPQLHQSIQFRAMDHRFFETTESHVRYDNDWFYAIGGREVRHIGAGYGMRSLMSSNALPADAVMLGARFQGFEYRASHYSFLGQPEPNPLSYGAQIDIPNKYMVHHRFAFREAWGEIGFSEMAIYSRRSIDLAYALPVSFIRNITNDLRDRDNFQIAFDATLRPVQGLQVKSTFLLDDLSMSKVGQAWWANKWAFNVGMMLTPNLIAWKAPLDAMLEYSRLEPYTYSHFDRQNSATNDGILFAGHLPPNSDELVAQIRWWTGQRYPVVMRATWQRHGKNSVDANGNLMVNIGSDPLQTLRRNPMTGQAIDNEQTTFLGGIPDNRFILSLTAGIELTRQWNVQLRAQYALINSQAQPGVWLSLRFEDF